MQSCFRHQEIRLRLVTKRNFEPWQCVFRNRLPFLLQITQKHMDIPLQKFYQENLLKGCMVLCCFIYVSGWFGWLIISLWLLIWYLLMITWNIAFSYEAISEWFSTHKINGAELCSILYVLYRYYRYMV